jgi:hypothetical protein
MLAFLLLSGLASAWAALDRAEPTAVAVRIARRAVEDAAVSLADSRKHLHEAQHEARKRGINPDAVKETDTEHGPSDPWRAAAARKVEG